jgi:hypothetical protein
MDDWTPDELEQGGYLYSVHSLSGDDWGAVEHPSPDLAVGDVVMVQGRLCEVVGWSEVLDGAALHRRLEVRPLAGGSA